MISMDEWIQAAIERQWATAAGRIVWVIVTLIVTVSCCWLFATAV